MVRKAENGADMIERDKSKDVGALAELWPFMKPYKMLAGAAVLALMLTATVSLVLPMAVRRVVDNFGAEDGALLNRYFMAALAIAGLLAIGTGLRYALVTRLGERVVADIRKAVFDRVIGMSPAFFEGIMTGEVLSRITTDTTLILSVIGSSVSIALRNIADLCRRSGADAGHLGQADGAGAVDRAAGDRADPDDGPQAAQAEPRQSGLDRQQFGQCRRGAAIGADCAGLHP